MITIEQMIQREVNCCLSSLVSTLAKGAYHRRTGETGDLIDLCEQAAELAASVPDYEEAARQEGWGLNDDGYFERSASDEPEIIKDKGDWRDVCEYAGIDPYDWEVFEHWAVSPWLAEKLEAEGEKVDKDFAGMNVWARTCTGQSISSDGCIQRIHAAMVQS